jgi:outer membrane protein assembly factor BamE (lipoprotein component of BamABCDE complex)
VVTEGQIMKMRLAMAAIVLAVTACVFALFVGPGSYITIGAYQRIEVGMTRWQVEDILGGPARNESAHQWEHYSDWYTGIRQAAGPNEWWGQDMCWSSRKAEKTMSS